MSNVVTEAIDNLLARWGKNSEFMDVRLEIDKIQRIAVEHSKAVAEIQMKQDEEIARFERLYNGAVRVAEENEEAFKEELDELKEEINSLRKFATELTKEKVNCDKLILLQADFMIRKEEEFQKAWD